MSLVDLRDEASIMAHDATICAALAKKLNAAQVTPHFIGSMNQASIAKLIKVAAMKIDAKVKIEALNFTQFTTVWNRLAPLNKTQAPLPVRRWDLESQSPAPTTTTALVVEGPWEPMAKGEFALAAGGVVVEGAGETVTTRECPSVAQ